MRRKRGDHGNRIEITHNLVKNTHYGTSKGCWQSGACKTRCSKWLHTWCTEKPVVAGHEYRKRLVLLTLHIPALPLPSAQALSMQQLYCFYMKLVLVPNKWLGHRETALQKNFPSYIDHFLHFSPPLDLCSEASAWSINSHPQHRCFPFHELQMLQQLWVPLFSHSPFLFLGQYQLGLLQRKLLHGWQAH